MGKFVIKKTNTGIKFDLKASNGQVVATSQVYKDKAYCVNGIESVRKNAPAANIEDQTVKDFKVEKCPKFEIYTDKPLPITSGNVLNPISVLPSLMLTFLSLTT